MVSLIIQDYAENMGAHRDNKAWMQYDLESTAKLLAKHFPSSFVWLVKSSRLHLGTYACYNNFVETSVHGVPDHSTNVGAVAHLRRLLDSAVRKGDIYIYCIFLVLNSRKPRFLIGDSQVLRAHHFSKGLAGSTQSNKHIV